MARTRQTAKKSTDGKFPGRPDSMTKAARIRRAGEEARAERIRRNNEIGRQKALAFGSNLKLSMTHDPEAQEEND